MIGRLEREGYHPIGCGGYACSTVDLFSVTLGTYHLLPAEGGWDRPGLITLSIESGRLVCHGCAVLYCMVWVVRFEVKLIRGGRSHRVGMTHIVLFDAWSVSVVWSFG